MSFNYLICLDVEATCWKQYSTKHKSEIIEIAAILLNVKTGASESKFHSYVRPTRNPKLSDFCVKLTGVTQTAVDSEEPFPDVLKRFIDWLEDLQKQKDLRLTSPAGIRATDGANTTFCSWSNSDLHGFFRKDCERNNISCPSYLNAWIDVQKRFKTKYSAGMNRNPKFCDALARVNIPMVGRAHSAISDATNLAAMVMHLVKNGVAFGIAADYYY